MGMSLAIALLGLGLIASGILFDLDAFDGWLSGVTIGAFLAFTGFLAILIDPMVPLALVGIIVVGLIVSVGTRFAMRFLDRADNASPPELDSIVGMVGVVTVEIPENAIGQISIKMPDGTPLRLSASADNPVERKTEVLVTSILSPTLVQVTTRF